MTGLPRRRAVSMIGADDALRQHALGIIRQHHRADCGSAASACGDHGGLACRRSPAAPSPNPPASDGSNGARRRSAPCAWCAVRRRPRDGERSAPLSLANASVSVRAGIVLADQRRRKCSARRGRRCCARHCRRRRSRPRCARPQAPASAPPAKCA